MLFKVNSVRWPRNAPAGEDHFYVNILSVFSGGEFYFTLRMAVVALVFRADSSESDCFSSSKN